MVFSSAIFLFAFFPLVFLMYHAVPGMKGKNAVLAVFSLIFYAFGQPVYVLLLLTSVMCNYVFGCMLTRVKGSGKWVICGAVIVNIGLLSLFKYLDFFIENINVLTGLGLSPLGIALPIGISFYTFQGLSYVIDVYRDREMATKNFPKLLLYISFFPQLIAGPIIKFHDISGQLDERNTTVEDTAAGLRRFTLGLAKKLLIANTMGFVADAVFSMGQGELNIAAAWLGAICYTLQIYFDFSGYSDMAIGLGRVFGLHFQENFKHPYGALSIRAFWRRWHISLTSWFREYLYIPLGGNRKGRVRTSINKVIIFFVTGIWHGANWTFVLWGLWHGLFSVLEDHGIIPADRLKNSILGRGVGHIYTMLVVILGFVMFRADTVSQGILMIQNMFFGFQITPEQWLRLQELCSPMLLLAILIFGALSLPVLPKLKDLAEKKSEGIRKGTERFTYAFTLALLLLCIMNLSAATFNPFIYFQF